MKSDRAKLVHESAAAAFREFVRGALSDRKIDTSEQTEYYLVRLLETFVRVSPGRLARALGPELLAASQLEAPQRYSMLKDLADTTLFLSGVFIDHLEDALPTTDYFFAIGSTAYLHLHELDPGGAGGLGDTFGDLGRRFELFAGALGAIADRDIFASDQQALRIYRRWLTAGRGRDAARLVALGIIPDRGDDTGRFH
jgi:hypothetical protein